MILPSPLSALIVPATCPPAIVVIVAIFVAPVSVSCECVLHQPPGIPCPDMGRILRPLKAIRKVLW
jgi:hypothetical protein